MKSEKAILIVGAGPVGLTMAAFLHHHGVRFRIIDKNSHQTETSNAIIVHARTLELLRIIGIEQQFISQGIKVKKFNLISNKNELAHWDMDNIDSDFNYMLSISQKLTEQILINYLENSGVKIERQTELTNIKNHVDHVKATIRTNTNEQEIINYKWVIGCDGYRSTLRKLLDIKYSGEDMPLNFLILDVPLDGEIDRESGYAVFSDTLSTLLLPLEKTWRVIAEVAKEPQYHCAHGEMPTEKTFQEILDTLMPKKIQVGKAIWSSKFLVHERLSESFNEGRVFLCGDAAHAHSPAGGQGMNTGMQDAINLAWKLAFVIKGQANVSLLNSYQEERRAVAADVIKSSSRLIKFGTLRNKPLIFLRDTIMPKISRLNSIQKGFCANLSETNIHYEGSSIVAGKKTNNITPGQRIPNLTFTLQDTIKKSFSNKIGTNFLVLDFCGDATATLSNFTNIVQIITPEYLTPALAIAYGMEKGGYVVIRPDQFIGYLGKDINEVESYLKIFS